MNRPVDLTNCDREPIHIPGSIQPFGFLLGLQSDFKVCMASENVADYLGRDYTDVFQRPITEVFSKAAVDAIRARVDYLSGPDTSERIFGVPLQDGGKPSCPSPFRGFGLCLRHGAHPSGRPTRPC